SCPRSTVEHAEFAASAQAGVSSGPMARFVGAVPADSSSPLRVYYGWPVLLVASAATVGTLPGRTQGLGLITEGLLADLHLDRVSYAELNFWSTSVGAGGAPAIRPLSDR